MSRIGKFVVAAIVVMPAVASAQRPSATVQTRSAELYLANAEKQQVPAEKAKLYKTALDAAMKGVQSDANNSKTWFTLGVIYARMGDAVGADTAFTKAETLWPDYKKDTEQERLRAYIAAFNAGVTAIQANKADEAIRNLEAAQQVYPKKPTAALNLANLYARANQADKAAEQYRKALAVLQGPERKAIPAAEEKQWATWEEAAAFNLAQILAMSDKNEEAAQAYLDFLAKNPTNVTAKSNLAIVYNRMGKKAEAQKMYQELLSQDLSDEDFFAVGVGLYRGEQYANAADAFRKSLTKNTVNRDAYFNLAQAIYSQIQPLEDARSKAKPTEVKGIDAKLSPLYDELISVSEKARELDPNSRNVLALLARGYRGKADVSDAKAATEWKNKTLKVMETHQGMGVEVSDVQLTSANGEAKLTGNVVGVKAAEGSPVKLTVTFLGKDGKVLGTQDVEVKAPAAEAQVPFTATLKTTEAVGGWKYEVAK